VLKSIVSGSRSGKSGAASVTYMNRRSASTGRSKPAVAASSRDQTPAARMTPSVSIRPRAVSTPTTRPPSTRIRRTAHDCSTRAPSAAARRAHPCTTRSGVTVPATALNTAPQRSSTASCGTTSCASSVVNRRVSMPAAA
jgi:hypothetical protein